MSKKAKIELHKAGFDVVSSAIENYKAEIQRENRDMKYVKNGSTFFNGAWRDYVVGDKMEDTMPQQQRRKSF